jgi:putative hydrolase of the HAD superfamily
MNEASPKLDLIAFDADDTLWHSETLYRGVEAKFKALLAAYSVESLDPPMHDNEIRNLEFYGYGIKGFILSLIETSIELTEGRISAPDIAQILAWGKEMQAAPVELFDHALEVVAHVAATYPLMLITKGDLFDQEAKLTRSGLRRYFRHVEIVSEKSRGSYTAILQRYQITPSRFLMIGNSLRSDILPVLALGGRAVYIPSHITWEHEAVAAPNAAEYEEIEHLALLPDLIKNLQDRG